MPGGWEFIITSGIVVAGGLVFGLAGFGFALFVVPPLLLFHTPTTIVTMVNILSFTGGFVVLRGERHLVRFAIIRSLVPGAIVGLIAGTLVLRVIDGRVIKLVAGVFVVLFALYVSAGLRVPGAHRKRAPEIAGFGSGLMGTTTGLTGPPVALLFTARDLPPAVFRVTITTYFIVINAIAIGLLGISGQLHGDDLQLATWMIAPSLFGRWAGRRLADFVSPGAFRRIVSALLLITGASGVVSALLSLR